MSNTAEGNDRPGGPDAGAAHDEGGDPACWLDRVCEVCGRIDERPGPGTGGCPYCGAGAAGTEAGGGTAGDRPDRSDTARGAAPPPASPASGRPSGRRDRDEQGRARNARPRDGLGRPLPYGSAGVARQPEGVPRTPAESLAEAQRLLDDGMPFHAHEVLEDAWKAAPEAERGLWRGLAQLAVGLTHAARGNVSGGRSLLDRGAVAIEPYADGAPYGIDVAGLVVWARDLAGRLSGPVPAAGTAPRLRDGTGGVR
ncbi:MULTISPECIES: DUF309 domain-containing protein [unclassified Streptomyces]|uniref:DUF309 domain-containing protein n=1 Tax=unclassified Streptomyces TaxID=2593676 RepID=UPI0038215DCB